MNRKAITVMLVAFVMLAGSGAWAQLEIEDAPGDYTTQSLIRMRAVVWDLYDWSNQGRTDRGQAALLARLRASGLSTTVKLDLAELVTQTVRAADLWGTPLTAAIRTAMRETMANAAAERLRLEADRLRAVATKLDAWAVRIDDAATSLMLLE